MARCDVCFRKCEIQEDGVGFCGVRTCRENKIVPLVFGGISSLALDPIEKKPLYHFHRGKKILSVGFFGCNLRCPFCQNYEISWSDEARKQARGARILSPSELQDLAVELKSRGNIGVAYTYNEPMTSYEYVHDSAKLIHEAGLANALVTNGTAEQGVLHKILPFIDAMNIDLKGFTDRYYEKILGENRQQVMEFIETAVKHCHVELTTLIVPGEHDSEEEMRVLSSWVAGLKDSKGKVIGSRIPLHISRFFPRSQMTDRPATNPEAIYRLKEVAEENLRYVYPGNLG